jgi:RNA polymerase sigma-70 factor (ECF subfamily)
MTTNYDLAARFEADRPHLRGVAYRLVGSLEDSDDAVQRAWLKASQADLRDVDNLTGWFTTVTARECFDLLRARKRRAEVPLDDQPATPAVPGAEEEAVLAESVGLALLVVLERLSPAQRVAFVLHDLFSFPFDEVGKTLDRSPAAAKKLASRARERVLGHSADDQRIESGHFRLVEAFLAASRNGDIRQLLDLLAPGVVRRVDRVLVPEEVPTEMRGAREVAEETKLFAARASVGVTALVDGAPGIVIAPYGRLQAVLRLTVRRERIEAIDIIGAPDRLDRVALAIPPGVA